MNRVESLLRTPFSQLPLEQKLEVKRLGPYQPRNCPLIQSYAGGKRTRAFSSAHFDKNEWLTYGEDKNALFCFYCLLFDSAGTGSSGSCWNKIGYRDLKHLSERLKTHQKSQVHMASAVKYKLFGRVNVMSQLNESYRVSVCKHNELVDKNRHVLSRVIDAIKFIGVHELPLRGHDEKECSLNRGVFLDLIKYTASIDSILREHLDTATVAKGTSKTIQNDVLDSIYHIYLQHLFTEIVDAEFLSIQSDETTDITCLSQLVVIFRFTKFGMPVERFHSFVAVDDRTAVGISYVLKKTLQPYSVESKLIAQTYDGAAVMSGSRHSVQVLMKEVYPHAHFLHCYAHQLNLVVKKMCLGISSVKIFFANLSGFSSFFSVSPKRSDLLRDICKHRLPRCVSTRWNFQSRVVQRVSESRVELLECFSVIESSPVWDDTSIREAAGLKRLLEDEEFLFFLKLFCDIFMHVDTLYSTFQSRMADGTTAQLCIAHFCEAISHIRANVHFAGDTALLRRGISVQNLLVAAYECCDILMSQIQHRLNSDQLVTFALLNPRNFPAYKIHFPSGLLRSVPRYYPMIDIARLESELTCLYSNTSFSEIKTTSELSKFLVENSLSINFATVTSFLNIILTTPISSAESERSFSTLKRIKTFLRNRMGQDRLNALAVLSIHNDVVLGIPDFNKLVIEHFANKKSRRAQYLYKT